MKKHLLLCGIFFVLLIANIITTKAQNFDSFESMEKQNFYEQKKVFERYWADKDTKEKGKGWKQYKRWEWFWGERLYPTGEFPNPAQTYIEYLKEQRKNSKLKKNKKLSTGDWQNLGPTTSTGGYAGLGRVNVVREHPENSNTIFAGAASGGLWKSTDNGSTWSTNTDELGSLGVTDLLFDPDDASIMYLATGDGDHSDAYSIGVLKSTDGGDSWNTTGLNWTQNNNRTISRLLIDPSDGNVLYAAGSFGIYKTTNGGNSWSLIFNSMSVKDMAFKPGTPSTIYAARTSVYRSTDSGNSWTRMTDGLPTSGIQRIALAVSADNPNYVYALMSSTANSGYLGIYRSTNSGTTWTLMSSTPNILGWNATGSDTGGQGWYDLCLVANPTNVNEIYSGGINIWKSTNGGANWTRNTYWTSAYSPTIHADQHDLWFEPNGNRLYAGNDGGVYRTSNGGTSWNWIGNGLEITQYYRLGVSATNSNLVIAGAQDNGTKLMNNSTWSDKIGGDGMECIINHSNANIMYGSLYYGAIRKSTNGGNNFAPLSLPREYSSGYGAWVTPYVMHPTNSDILYVGYRNVFKTTDGGSSWTQISNFTSGIHKVLHVAPSNDNYIYSSTGSSYLRVTTNGGTTWNEYSLPAYTTFTYLAISENNPAHIWATFSGYTSGAKVYFSTNSGQSWTNISGTLPNVPANCIVYQKNYNNRVYVGTDIGVYYRDDNTSDWQYFSTALPNVVVTELEIHYDSNLLYAATFGRGLWKTSIPTVSLPAPELVSPANNETNIERNVTMSWNEVDSATGYVLQYSTNNDFATNTEVLLTGTSYTINGLDYYTTYYWRVKATTDDVESDWYDVFSFTTVNLTLAAPSLSSPTDGATDQTINITMNWNEVDSATGYVLQYSMGNDFATNTEVSLTGTSYTINGLDYYTTYYWRVKATTDDVESDWSDVFSFTTVNLTLAKPKLSSPKNKSQKVKLPVKLVCSSVTNATSYDFEYSLYSNFSNSTVVNSSTTSVQLSGLSYGVWYYWRAQARNNNIVSGYTASWKFKCVSRKYSIFEEEDEYVYDNYLNITPNPITETAEFSFRIEEDNYTTISIYNIQGQLVEQVYTGHLTSGQYSINLNMTHLVNGVYVAVLSTGEFVLSQKMVVYR